jgi:thiosulfate/3-mercaptopyruvate sulfurtransferase
MVKPGWLEKRPGDEMVKVVEGTMTLILLVRVGHIPRTVNIPWFIAVREDGTFKPLEELRKIYEEKGVTPDKEVIVYCRIGERAAFTFFVLRELLGYPRVRVYDGSWSEWGNMVGAPVKTGEEP